ncbi:unnamed protein product, partial [Taenia asiatica]|uniref:Fibronectin type-III domain-containing protein n=1 Tax=Taenia asiatica TaxID=60517 RepID=A0A0R3VX70_TAEAS
SEAPQNVTIEVVDAYNVRVSWKTPTKVDGTVVGYIVQWKANKVPKSNIYVLLVENLLLSNLSPKTLISVTVCTRIQRMSEAPQNVTIEALDPSVVRVSWRAPTTVYGTIVGYIAQWKANNVPRPELKMSKVDDLYISTLKPKTLISVTLCTRIQRSALDGDEYRACTGEVRTTTPGVEECEFLMLLLSKANLFLQSNLH